MGVRLASTCLLRCVFPVCLNANLVEIQRLVSAATLPSFLIFLKTVSAITLRETTSVLMEAPANLAELSRPTVLLALTWERLELIVRPVTQAISLKLSTTPVCPASTPARPAPYLQLNATAVWELTLIILDSIFATVTTPLSFFTQQSLTDV